MHGEWRAAFGALNELVGSRLRGSSRFRWRAAHGRRLIELLKAGRIKALVATVVRWSWIEDGRDRSVYAD